MNIPCRSEALFALVLALVLWNAVATTAFGQVPISRLTIRMEPGRALAPIEAQLAIWGATVQRADDGTPDGFIAHELAKIAFVLVKIPTANLSAALSWLRQSLIVRSALESAPVSVHGTPNDPYFGTQYDKVKMGAPTAWNTTVGRTDMPIAVVDTGVDASHPDLSGRVLRGFNFITGTTVTAPEAESAATAGAYLHGTAVAGVAAATGNNAAGMAGMVWRNPVLPVRVADSAGLAPEDRIAAGIIWAVDHGARIVNVSMGPLQGHVLARAAAVYARNRNVLCVFSAGNTGLATGEPRDLDMPFIAATDAADQLAAFSTRGPSVVLCAPGDRVTALKPAARYAQVYGTSFSSPNAAGAAALAWAANPALDADQVLSLLMGTAADLGAAGDDPVYGRGRVNAAAAVAASLRTAPRADTTPPLIAITSPAPSAVATGAPLKVMVSAADNHRVARVEYLLDGTPLGSQETDPYFVFVETSTLPVGTHLFTARATDPAGNATQASISVLVSPLAVTAIAPRSGPLAGGQTATLSGSYLLDVTEVRFGDRPATILATSPQLTVRVPAGAAPGPVDVTVSSSTRGTGTLSAGWTYIAPPTISAIDPAQGDVVGGTAVTLRGGGLANATVWFGAAYARITAASADGSSLTCLAPASFSTGPVDVRVVTPGGVTVRAAGFTYTFQRQPLAVTAATGATGPVTGGRPFSLTGSGLYAPLAVRVGGRAASITGVDPLGRFVTVIAPAGAATGAVDIEVESADGARVTLPGGYVYTVASLYPYPYPYSYPVAPGAAYPYPAPYPVAPPPPPAPAP